MKNKISIIYDTISKYVEDEMSVYASQAAFFIVMSAFPFVMLLLCILQLIPSLSGINLVEIIENLLPPMFYELVESVLRTLSTRYPATLISITAIAALWSASKGMMSMERAFNIVWGDRKKRNYIYTRAIAIIYTIGFIAVCLTSMVLLVLGRNIVSIVSTYFPSIAMVMRGILSYSALISMLVLSIVFLLMFKTFPKKKLGFRSQIPGVIFATAGWMIFSYLYSLYFQHFQGLSYMYGSLAAIILFMLWLYFCICIIFLGVELNSILYNRYKKEES